jgi:uncharacterized protein (TIGR02466 family)
MNIEYIFPTPIWSSILDIDLDPIKKYIYKLKESSEGRKISNFGGWQSKEFFPSEETNESVQSLLKIIERYLKVCYTDYGFFEEPKVDNYWFNINHPGCSNLEHTHSRCFLSGTIYIDVPENSGNIVFKRSAFEDYIISSNIGSGTTKLSASYWKYSVVPNQLMIFPGWLLHEVEKNNSNNDRISMAFNVRTQTWK